MKKILVASVLLCSINILFAQTARLIVRGDDMGYSHSGNRALIKSFKEGIETSVEVIVASPWFPEAVKLLQQNPGIDVGIHLALSSEWENIKWRPLTDCASLKDADGYFFPMIYPNKNYPGQALTENKWTIADVEKEFRAQIEMAIKKIPGLSHISSHMGCVNISEEVKALSKRLAKEYHISIDPADYQIINIGFEGKHETTAEKVTAFMAMLGKLEKGKTYLFVEHPGLDNDELKAVYHIGYEQVAMDRQGVTDLFTNAKVKEAIKQREIRLVSYRDLLNR